MDKPDLSACVMESRKMNAEGYVNVGDGLGLSGALAKHT